MTPVSRPEMKNGFDSKNRAINNQFLSRPESWWAIWIAVGAFLLYAMALGHGYNMDDELVTRGHKLTSKGFEGLRQIFNSPYYSDDMGYSYEYRPVTLASFAIEHELFGESPGIGHFINIVFFGITVVVLFKVLRKLFLNHSIVFPVIAAVLFVVHPLHVEAVASIKNRDELLALLGGLCSALVWLRWHEQRLFWALFGMSFFLVIGLLSKMSVISFVLILPIIAIYRNTDIRVLAFTLIICMVILVAMLTLRTDLAPIQISGIALLASCLIIALRLLYDGSELNKLIPLIKQRIATSSDVSTEISSFMGKNWSWYDSLFLITTAMALIVGSVISSLPALTIVTAALLFHPLIIGSFRPLYFALTTVSLVPLMLIAFTEVWHLAFFSVALIPLSLLAFGNRISRNMLWLQFGFLVASIITYSVLKGLDMMSTGFHLLFLFLLALPAFVIPSEKETKIKVATIALVLLFGFVQLIRGSKPEYLVLSFLLIVLVYWKPVQHFKKSFLLILICIPLIAVFIKRPNGSHLKSEAVTMVNQSDEESPMASSYAKPPLQRSITKSEDRPLSFIEYPLGFSAPFNEKIATGISVIGHYLKLFIIPWPQSFYYGYRVFDRIGILHPKAIWSTLAVLALTGLALYGWIKRTPWSFGLISMLISIAVFSNLFEPVAGMAGDRLTYVASFGYCIALGYALTWLYERQRSAQGRSMVAVGIVLLLVTYSGMTIARNAQWKDALTLMRHDIEYVPNSAQAHNLLASHLMKNSFEPEYQQEAIAMRLEAIDHFKEAVRIWPEFFNVWFDLGRVYLIIDDPESALPCFKEAHRLDSTYYDATFNVAMIADKRGDATTAITYYEKCIRISPEMLPPYNELSYLLYRLGEYEASIAVNEKAIAYNANWPDPYKNIAQTYAAMNQPEKGQAYLQRLENMK